MQRSRPIVLASLLFAGAVAAGAQEQRPTPPGGQIAQPQGQPPAQQAQPALQVQPPPAFVPAPGLPTVELAPVLQRVARAANKRFLVDARVGPQIYLGGTEPNDVTYPVLLSILRTNNLAVVEIEGRTNIVPVAEVRTYPLPMVPNDQPNIAADEWVSRVLTTTNVEAAMLVPILRPLMPVWAHLAAFPPNRLLLVDRYANVQRVTAIVRALDVPPARN